MARKFTHHANGSGPESEIQLCLLSLLDTLSVLLLFMASCMIAGIHVQNTILLMAMSGSHSCWECRNRRLRCDSTQPHCEKCISRGKLCPGYGPNKPVKFRSVLGVEDSDRLSVRHGARSRSRPFGEGIKRDIRQSHCMETYPLYQDLRTDDHSISQAATYGELHAANDFAAVSSQ